MLRYVGGFVVIVVAIGGIIIHTPSALAETSSSNNFQFNETSVGTSGLLNSKSTNFGVTEATGDLGVGNSASSNFQIDAGSKTSHEPTLSFSVDQFNANFNSFSPSSSSVSTAKFSVSNYSSWGYAVQIYGAPPTNGTHTIAAMTGTPASPQTGIEQFGINLVANTIPSSVGANIDNGGFGFGTVAANYSTPNKYRYVNGETIASAPKSSGVSIYTISYLVNVAGRTPGGKYTSNQMLVVTGTY